MAQMNATEQACYEREKIEQMQRDNERARYEYERLRQEQYLKMNPPGMWSSRKEPEAVYGIPVEWIADLARVRNKYKLEIGEMVQVLERYGKIKEGK